MNVQKFRAVSSVWQQNWLLKCGFSAFFCRVFGFWTIKQLKVVTLDSWNDVVNMHNIHCLHACVIFFFRVISWFFRGAIFNFKQISSKKMSLCLLQEISRRQERKSGPSQRKNRGERKQEQRQKMRNKRAGHHSSLLMTAHEYGGVKWFQKLEKQMFPKLTGSSKHNYDLVCGNHVCILYHYILIIIAFILFLFRLRLRL